MVEVDGSQIRAYGVESSDVKRGPSTIPEDPFPANVDTEAIFCLSQKE